MGDAVYWLPTIIGCLVLLLIAGSALWVDRRRARRRRLAHRERMRAAARRYDEGGGYGR